ncbi:MAG: hypothetical protein AAGD11_02370 [Planctomycetota bacterium]
MKRFKAVVRLQWLVCAGWLLSALTAVGQTSVATWECLPEETVVALRVPNGQAVLDALRETKFGAVMLTEKRKASILSVCEKHGDDEWGEALETLRQYDLTFDEIASMFAGETGYAVTLAQNSEEQTVVLGLGWLQPGDELAAKFLDILARAVDEQDADLPVTRVDLEIADQSVMQLQLPSVETEYTEEFILPDHYDDLSEDDQSDAYNRAEEQFVASAVETTKYRVVLVCHVGDRLLVAHTFEAGAEEERDAAEQQVSDLMATVLAAHQAGGSDSFAPRLMDVPGIARTMTANGVPTFELLGDLRPIVAAARRAMDGDEAERWFRLFGLDGLGPFALRQTADGPKWLTQFSLSLPAPRSGLMKLLDQEMLAIDPPQWVPASVVRYFQMSFDLEAAYETIKDELTREFADETEAGFAMAETQAQNFTQTTLPELLGSLGNRHTIMSFGGDSGSTDSEDSEPAEILERMAFVWQVSDEEVWSRLMKVIAPFTSMAPGAEAAEEQGFSGYRMKSGANEGGLMLGKGYLVLGVGNGVVESVLSALNNPPSGSNALRGSDLFDRAAELSDLKPAMIAELTDNDRYMQMVMGKFNDQIGQVESMMEAMSDEDDDNGMFFFDLMRAIVPQADELSGLMGVSAASVEVNDDGVFSQALQELPAE